MKRLSVPKLVLKEPAPAERALKTYAKTGSAEKAMATFRRYGGRAAS